MAAIIAIVIIIAVIGYFLYAVGSYLARGKTAIEPYGMDQIKNDDL